MVYRGSVRDVHTEMRHPDPGVFPVKDGRVAVGRKSKAAELAVAHQRVEM